MSSVGDSVSRLDVRDLDVVIEGRKVLERISFSMAAGEVLGVLGPNGSGKTTLLEAIAGLRTTNRGTIAVEGHSLTSFEDRMSRVGFMPEGDTLPEETMLGVALGLNARDAVVAQFGLESLLQARATKISRGEAKRAELCATLKLGRPVMLLDEPFAAFDPRQLREIVPLVRNAMGNNAAVVTIHQMRTAELIADRLLLLAHGRAIAIGSLDELRVRANKPDASLDEVFLALLDQETSRAVS